MIGPRSPGSSRFRRQWGVAAASLLLVALLLRLPAVAQDDAFTATVTVDATADDVAKAREMARRDGQRKALIAVVDKLTGGPGKAKLPKLSDNQITDLVASFEVANEKMTAVRYTADYTYHFRPTETQTMLTAAGITLNLPNAPDTGTATAVPPGPGAPAAPGATPDNATQQQGPTQTLTATLPVDSLEDWIKLRGRLAGLPSIQKLDVKSLSRQEATVDIQYVGTLDQLKSSLATIHLNLEGSDPTWRWRRGRRTMNQIGLNLPNSITLARLMAVPLAIWLILGERYGIAFWVFRRRRGVGRARRLYRQALRPAHPARCLARPDRRQIAARQRVRDAGLAESSCPTGW